MAHFFSLLSYDLSKTLDGGCPPALTNNKLTTVTLNLSWPLFLLDTLRVKRPTEDGERGL